MNLMFKVTNNLFPKGRTQDNRIVDPSVKLDLEEGNARTDSPIKARYETPKVRRMPTRRESMIVQLLLFQVTLDILLMRKFHNQIS